MKKRDQGKQDSGNLREKKKEKRAIVNITEDGTVSKSASLAAIFKSSLPSDEEVEVHLFIASDVIAFISHESSHDTFVDSGCSCHFSPHHKYFIDKTFTILKKPINIHLGDASTIQAIGKGSLHYLMDTPKDIVPAI